MIGHMFQKEFAGKVVVLTGGSGQIGAALAAAYAAAGASLVILDVEAPGFPYQKPAERKSHAGIHFVATDIRSRASVSDSLSSMKDAFPTIDVLINCAGISVFTPFEERSDEQFDQVVDVNLKGTFLVTQEVVKEWKANATKGVILNFGSIYGVAAADQRIYGDSGRNSPEVYAITKAGVIQFTKYLARYLGPDGIRVNCVSPGGIFAGQKEFFVENYVYKTPLGRMGEPADLLGAVFFLTSSLSAYVTGVNLMVDGGFTIGQ